MDTERDEDGFSKPEPEIPSREINKPWIYACSPCQTENISVAPEKVGKWLLNFNKVHRSEVTGLTEQDYVWQSIKKLVEDNFLYKAKCCTALTGISEVYDKRENGVICCYTPDYTNKLDVKRAAEVIRRAVHCPANLFYKTDNDTRAGKYSHTGNNHACIYKHTAEGKLYERDPVVKYQWNLVNV